MPSMSSCGNIRPASTARILSSHSSAHMLMPTSPSPPSGEIPESSRGHNRRSCSASCFGGATGTGGGGGSEEVVEVPLHPVEVALQVRDERAVVQRGGRVVERYVRDIAALDQAAVNAGDRALPRHEPLQRVTSEDQDHLGPDELELALQVWRARLSLVGHRIAVHRRAALEDVGDVHVRAARGRSAQAACPAACRRRRRTARPGGPR